MSSHHQRLTNMIKCISSRIALLSPFIAFPTTGGGLGWKKENKKNYPNSRNLEEWNAKRYLFRENSCRKTACKAIIS